MGLPNNTFNGVLYCRVCLHGRGELIYYASCQSHCAVCQSELLPLDFSQRTPDVPSIESVLADPSASHWLCRALRGSLARDPVDAANDAEMLAKVLDERCRAILSGG
jgi:hypothetical protein